MIKTPVMIQSSQPEMSAKDLKTLTLDPSAKKSPSFQPENEGIQLRNLETTGQMDVRRRGQIIQRNVTRKRVNYSNAGLLPVLSKEASATFFRGRHQTWTKLFAKLGYYPVTMLIVSEEVTSCKSVSIHVSEKSADVGGTRCLHLEGSYQPEAIPFYWKELA
ncbi:hypothetical protein STEG23_030149 [Scotinomys teguina]